MVGVSIPQYAGWVLGTVVGVLVGSRLGDPNALGLDALFPAFFIALLFEEARGRRRLVAAGGGSRDRSRPDPARARGPADPGGGGGGGRGLEDALVTAVWVLIAALALSTAALKLAGPLTLGRPPVARAGC